MVNTYFKMLQNSIQEKYTNDILSDVQKTLRTNCSLANSNIYDEISKNQEKPILDNNLDVNVLLKYYVLNQILKDTSNNLSEQEQVITLDDTKNPNIKFNTKENKFYKYIEDKYSPADEIITVNEDGSYISMENIKSSSFKIKKVYDIEDSVMSLQVINPDGKIETNKLYSAEILNMRKEFVQKHKYSGYSGNSKDFIAELLNKLGPPIETGYYLDKHCKTFKWSETQKCFIRKKDKEPKSLFLADYEFINNIVVKKEYTGIK